MIKRAKIIKIDQYLVSNQTIKSITDLTNDPLKGIFLFLEQRGDYKCATNLSSTCKSLRETYISSLIEEHIKKIKPLSTEPSLRNPQPHNLHYIRLLHWTFSYGMPEIKDALSIYTKANEALSKLIDKMNLKEINYLLENLKVFIFNKETLKSIFLRLETLIKSDESFDILSLLKIYQIVSFDPGYSRQNIKGSIYEKINTSISNTTIEDLLTLTKIAKDKKIDSNFRVHAMIKLCELQTNENNIRKLEKKQSLKKIVILTWLHQHSFNLNTKRIAKTNLERMAQNPERISDCLKNININNFHDLILFYYQLLDDLSKRKNPLIKQEDVNKKLQSLIQEADIQHASFFKEILTHNFPHEIHATTETQLKILIDQANIDQVLFLLNIYETNQNINDAVNQKIYSLLKTMHIKEAPVFTLLLRSQILNKNTLSLLYGKITELVQQYKPLPEYQRFLTFLIRNEDILPKELITLVNITHSKEISTNQK